MFVMPMNRHLTWGDRQAEVSRDKNLKRLQKLAAMSPPPGTSAEEPSRPAAKAKSAAKGAKPAAKPATQSATKKAAPAKAAAKKKNSSKK
jgi:hypothetical protein